MLCQQMLEEFPMFQWKFPMELTVLLGLFSTGSSGILLGISKTLMLERHPTFNGISNDKCQWNQHVLRVLLSEISWASVAGVMIDVGLHGIWGCGDVTTRQAASPQGSRCQ